MRIYMFIDATDTIMEADAVYTLYIPGTEDKVQICVCAHETHWGSIVDGNTATKFMEQLNRNGYVNILLPFFNMDESEEEEDAD